MHELPTRMDEGDRMVEMKGIDNDKTSVMTEGVAEYDRRMCLERWVGVREIGVDVVVLGKGRREDGWLC